MNGVQDLKNRHAACRKLASACILVSLLLACSGDISQTWWCNPDEEPHLCAETREACAHLVGKVNGALGPTLDLYRCKETPRIPWCYRENGVVCLQSRLDCEKNRGADPCFRP